jgi:hypothetical protein
MTKPNVIGLAGENRDLIEPWLEKVGLNYELLFPEARFIKKAYQKIGTNRQ